MSPITTRKITCHTHQKAPIGDMLWIEMKHFIACLEFLLTTNYEKLSVRIILVVSVHANLVLEHM